MTGDRDARGRRGDVSSFTGFRAPIPGVQSAAGSLGGLGSEPMSTPRILLFSYILLGLVVGLVLENLVLALGGFGPLSFLNASVMTIDGFWSKAIGFALAIGLALFCWVDPRVKVPATQVVEEMQRVTWPTMAETRAATMAVIFATLICAVILGLFDYGWGMLTQQVYSP